MDKKADHSSARKGEAPSGFVCLPPSFGNAFVRHTMDLWAKLDKDGPVFGFRVQEHHCNAVNLCHGGMLMTFADTYLPTLARFDPGVDDGFTPTISLTADFIGPAKLGEWVEGRGSILRRTGRLLFIEGLIESAGSPVLRVSGVFKRGKAGERGERIQEILNLLQPDQSDYNKH